MLAAVLAAIAVPLLVSLGAAGLIRARFPSATGMAIGIGFLAANVAMAGKVPFLVPGPYDAPTVVAAVVTFVAAVLVYCRPSQRIGAAIFCVSAAAAVAWCIGAADLYLAATLANVRVALIIVGSGVAIVKVTRLIGSGEPDPGISAIAALGLAGVVAVGPGRFDAGLAASLGMAGIGWLLAAPPTGKVNGVLSAWLVSATLLIALGADLGRNALSPPWAMLLLLPCLWAGDVGRLLTASKQRRRKTPNPRLAMFMAMVLAMIAIIVAAALAAGARHRVL